MSLTDAAIRNAKTKDKPYKLSDGGGLFLWVQPSGGKWWRYKYRFAGKEKLLALGSYPDVSLAEARERHGQARKVLAAGNDPGAVKKEARRVALLKTETTFEAVTREWCEGRKHKWVTSYGEAMITRLEAHVFPKLGDRPVSEITAPELLSVLRVVENTGALDLAMRLLQASGQIFRYAIATGRADRNPAADLRGALKPPVHKHQAHLKEDELPEYLQKLEAYDGSLQTKLALKFLLLTFVRTGELRGAEWSEINLDKAEWRIPAERMKMRDPHIVPLSRQAVAVLKELQPVTGQWRYVFPNQHKPSGCMSENTMLYGLYRMGYHSKATGHGFRSTASTILNENGFAPDVIERQLAHSERNSVRAAYNHAQYLPERRKMMQWWADYLDEIAAKNKPPVRPRPHRS
jgi:integrase